MKEWTLMLYLAGDNNLSENMVTALSGLNEAFAETTIGERMTVVAVYDSGYPTTRTAHYVFSSTSQTSGLGGRRHDEPFSDADRSSNTERLRLAEFMSRAMREFPARHYGLIMSGHSDGVLGRTIFKDDNPAEVLSLVRVHREIKSALTRRGVDQLDLLGFDSCLMNMVEAGTEFSDVARVMVASAGNVPTCGWCYDKIFKKLAEEAEVLTSKSIARTIVTEFYRHSTDYRVGGRSVNIAAADLSRVALLNQRLNELADIFRRLLRSRKASRRNSPKNVADVYFASQMMDLIDSARLRSQLYMYDQAVDVVDFAANLVITARRELFQLDVLGTTGSLAEKHRSRLQDLITTSQSVISTALEYVFANAFSGPDYQFSAGVSIFLPWTCLAFEVLRESYGELRFATVCHRWTEFLDVMTLRTLRPFAAMTIPDEKKFADWYNHVEDLQRSAVDGRISSSTKKESIESSGVRDVSFKDVSFKDVSFKDVSFKDVSFKDLQKTSDQTGFYGLFRRFRNTPIGHEVGALRLE